MRLALTCAVLLLAPHAAHTQERPPFPPQTPFRAEARLQGGMPADIRYDGGWARADITTPSGKATAYIDIEGRRAIVALNMQGLTMGLEMGADDAGVPDFTDLSAGRAQRAGSDTVAGAACDLWRMEHDDAPRPSLACITADGVPLRVHQGPEATDTVVFEVTRYEPGPQDGAALRPPPGLATMKVEGLQNLQGLGLPGLR